MKLTSFFFLPAAVPEEFPGHILSQYTKGSSGTNVFINKVKCYKHYLDIELHCI